MTREKAKELLDIIKAYSEGKEIEFLNLGDKWKLLPDPMFDGEPFQYRIKPEPKYRPFESVEECFNEMKYHEPFGWIKNKNTNNLYNILTIYKDEDTINISVEDTINISVKDFVLKPFTALESFIFADGTPFGIKEEK